MSGREDFPLPSPAEIFPFLQERSKVLINFFITFDRPVDQMDRREMTGVVADAAGLTTIEDRNTVLARVRPTRNSTDIIVVTPWNALSKEGVVNVIDEVTETVSVHPDVRRVNSRVEAGDPEEYLRQEVGPGVLSAPDPPALDPPR